MKRNLLFLPAFVVFFIFANQAHAQVPSLKVLDATKGRSWQHVILQSLLNETDLATQISADGIGGPNTAAKLNAFKNSQGMPKDGKVDAATWGKLFQGRERFLVQFRHPTWSAAEYLKNSPIYESSVKVYRIDSAGVKLVDDFSGSLKCDYSASQSARVGIENALKEHGIIKNGAYELNLGFHSRRNQIPDADDLKPKTRGALRPCLVVKRDGAIPCYSKKSGKTTSSLIHIHNGFNSGRDSSGCPTIKMSEWDKFIKIFIGKYPNLGDWYVASKRQYFGKSIGALLVVDN